jgi:hypothetical protein
VRGMKVVDLGGAITVPVGRGTLGRIMNVIGQPVDDLGPIEHNKRLPIHRPPPAFDEQATTTQLFETGVKVIDLMQPFLKGGKVGVIRWCRRWQGRDHYGTDQQCREAAWGRFRFHGCGGTHARRERSLVGNDRVWGNQAR